MKDETLEIVRGEVEGAFSEESSRILGSESASKKSKQMKNAAYIIGSLLTITASVVFMVNFRYSPTPAVEQCNREWRQPLTSQRLPIT